MSYYIIIRGPAASGKTTIARQLTKELKAHYIDFDAVLAMYNLDKIDEDGISTQNFIKGNELILDDVKQKLESNRFVIIDACFYRKRHLHHVIKNIPYKHIIFSLKTPLKECLLRNKSRKGEMQPKDIKAVYKLVSKLDVGIPIQTKRKTVREVLEEIKKQVSNF